MRTDKELYYVDCFDSEYWIICETMSEAADAASDLAGHGEINERLHWSQHIATGHCADAEETAEMLQRAGVTVHGGKS